MASLLDYGADANEEGSGPVRAVLGQGVASFSPRQIEAIQLLLKHGARTDDAEINDLIKGFHLLESSTFQSLAFDPVVAHFRKHLKCPTSAPPPVVVHRHDVLNDAFLALEALSASHPPCAFSVEVSHLRPEVSFYGEVGIDGGGIRSDLWTALFSALRDSDLVEMSSSGSYWLRRWLIQFSASNLSSGPLTADCRRRVRMFGDATFRSAIVDAQPIGLPLAPSTFGSLLGRKAGFDDLRLEDPELAQVLVNLIQSTEEGTSIPVDDFGAWDHQFSDALVSNSNVVPFCTSVAEWRLQKSRSDALTAFFDGFFYWIDKRLPLQMKSDELQIAVCGRRSEAAEVMHLLTFVGFPSDSATPTLFQTFLLSLDHRDLSRLVRFVTGRATMPPDGICIRCTDKCCDHFPVGRTCAQTLELPPYPSLAMLRAKMGIVISSVDALGFEIL